jgi:hypothetical protein
MIVLEGRGLSRCSLFLSFFALEYCIFCLQVMLDLILAGSVSSLGKEQDNSIEWRWHSCGKQDVSEMPSR